MITKKSEELMWRAAEETNDLRAMGLYSKVLREQRYERFEEDYLPRLKELVPIEFSVDKYVIDTKRFGKLDFYPKVNKVLIRKENQWKKPGLKWLLTNIKKKNT